MDRTGRILIWIGIAVLVGILLLYGLYEARHLISGPQISISSPTDGVKVRTPIVIVQGVTRNTNLLTLNGREIFIDTKGNFREEVTLTRGYAIIALVGHDRFKRETRKELRVIYEPETISGPPPKTEPTPAENIGTTTPNQ